VAVLLLLAPAGGGVTAAAATAATEASAPAELDEVVVRSRRAALEALRARIDALEDRFTERFNELNPVEDFDVHCVREARTGTRVKKRSCRPVYVDRALQEEGAAGFIDQQRIRDGAAPVGAGSLSPPVSAQGRIDARRPEFQQNMRRIVEANPELVEILRERDELGTQYERAVRKPPSKPAR
jgi:hypothetical protein